MQVNFRYEYDEYKAKDQNFVDYVVQNNIKESSIKIKKVLIFIHYYDKNQNNEQCFSSNLFDDNRNHLPRVEWLIINDCNIPSSSLIFPACNNFDNLIGLDLSFNNICNINAIAHLMKSPKLMYLDLSHNPIEFQEDLKEAILMINPHISVINRKRVTPTDFYNIIIKNPDFINNNSNKNDDVNENNRYGINFNNIQSFRQCQLASAIRTIQKDRIYPPTVEKGADYIDNSFNLGQNYINTSEIQAIDLSNCDLIYFDFTMFKEAFFIDISNNRIKSEHDLKFSREHNQKLLYLNINGNDFRNYNLLEDNFPKCNIIPYHSENDKYKINSIANTEDIHCHNILNFQSLLDNFQMFGIKERQKDSEIKIYLRNENSNIKFVKLINKKSPVKPNNDKYKINLITFKETLDNITLQYPDEAVFDERVQKLSVHLNDNNNFEIDRNFNKNFSLWFIAYLNLSSFPIEAKNFHTIFSNCFNLRKLIVKFMDIPNNYNQSVSDIYFRDIEKNVLQYLTDLDITFSDYSFDSKKQYNKFIKKIAHFRSLKNLCITDYTNKYSENDEIDTTFKYLRGLNTFNGYRNLIPPTPAQYCALNTFIINNNKRVDDNDGDNDNDNNDNDNNDNNENNKYCFNLNNMQFFKLYENDLNQTSDNYKWLQALPIRSMDVLESHNENKKVEDVKKIVNDHTEFFDQFPRLRYVNDMRIKKELKPKSREESVNENKAFESWTANLDKTFELLYQVQFFIVYSFSASSSFVSKLLYFFYSSLIPIERFFIKNHIQLSTDFTSTYEKIFVYSVLPVSALVFLLWEPSYEFFIRIATEKMKGIKALISAELAGTVFICLCSYLDSAYIEHEFVFFPYLVQFIIFSSVVFLIGLYYVKRICIELVEEYKEKFEDQSQNSFNGYLEFKFLKSKVAYSILIILIMPICGLLFESPSKITFVYCYKFAFTIFIICYVFTMLFKSTNEDTTKIIDFLDLNKNKEEELNEDIDEDDQGNGNENDIKTHYLATKSNDNDENKVCSLSKFSNIFGGAFHYKLTNDDKKYQSFAAEFRTPTQIFYSNYRYRGLQKFYGLIEVIQRILTELITYFWPRWLFIVPVLFTIYVMVWWPNYDVIVNVSVLVTSVGKILMSLFNFLFDYFGVENKRAESILTYMNIVGIAFNIFGILVSCFHSFYQIIIENRNNKKKNYKPDKVNIADLNIKGINEHLIANDDDDSL